MFQHLNFDATMKRHTFGGNVVCPQENPRIASGNQMPPFDFKNEVLIHLLRTDLTVWLASADQDTVTDLPCFGRGVRNTPVIEVTAVE